MPEGAAKADSLLSNFSARLLPAAIYEKESQHYF